MKKLVIVLVLSIFLSTLFAVRISENTALETAETHLRALGQLDFTIDGTYLLQDDEGQISEVHSISAGLDYPGVGPEHSFLKDLDRVVYQSVTDEEALQAAVKLSRLEGILPALESAHALAYLEYLMPITTSDEIVVVNLSGRGDKDLDTLMNNIDV